MKPLIRIGIAGLGFGASVHAPVLLNFHDVEIVGIAGRSAKKAQNYANELGIAKGCGSVTELLDLGLDAITFALPPDQVIVNVEAALEKRVAILCEKPLGNDPIAAASLAKKALGLTTAVDFIFAELDVFIKLKEIIENGTLGNVRHANLLWLTESFAHQNQTWSWKVDADQKGGVLTLFGSHVLYLAEWLFGQMKSVRANFRSLSSSNFAPIGGLPAEDLIDCCFRHVTGATLTCTIGNANPGITIHRWTVVLDGGTVVIENKSKDFTAFNFFLKRIDGPQEYFSELVSDRDGRISPFRKLARRFVNAVREEQCMLPDFKAGARVQYLDNKVRISATTKKEVNLD